MGRTRHTDCAVHDGGSAGAWLPAAGAPGLRGRLIVATRVVWFSTVGTVLARRAAKRQAPGTVVICHNDALAGDVYVNHGIVLQAMRNRGGAFARVLRNPFIPSPSRVT